ncbi:MAG: hypothetical protein WBM02_08010 [bacterium]
MKTSKLIRIIALVSGIVIGLISLVMLKMHLSEQTVFKVFIPGLAVSLVLIGTYFSLDYAEKNLNSDLNRLNRNSEPSEDDDFDQNTWWK